MPNYKEMYLKLFRATETAINGLIAAQRECEELYISDADDEPNLIVLPNQADEDSE